MELATLKQINYIAYLERQAGEPLTDCMGMTKQQATYRIRVLKGEKPRKVSTAKLRRPEARAALQNNLAMDRELADKIAAD